MKPIPPTFQTLFADLQQRIQWADGEAGSVYFQVKNGVRNAYVKRSVGAARIDQFLGPEKAPTTSKKIEAIERANAERRERRKLVRVLKDAGLPSPTLAMGRIIEAISAGGLFNPPNGLVLVGTTAFQTFAPLLGAIPEAQALITQDTDLALIELAFAADRPDSSIHAVLKRAGIDMRPHGQSNPPERLIGGGLAIEFLTSLRRNKAPVVPAPGLGVSAQALPFMEYLVQEPIEVAMLHGPGVLVRAPRPERFAVHKLIVADRRRAGDVKRQKDLMQARQMIEAFEMSGQRDAIDDALEDARARGRAWDQAINRSLAAIEQAPRAEQRRGKGRVSRSVGAAAKRRGRG